MRRLICLLAAAVLVAGPLATAGHAMAEDHHGKGGGRGHEDNGGGRWAGGGRQGGGPPPFRGNEGRGNEGRGNEGRGNEGRGGEAYRGEAPRGYERADPRIDPRYGYRGEQRADPRYDPRGYAPPPGAYSAAPRRGGFLSPGGSAPVIGDYERYRLRPPPPGYDWVHTPRGAALVSRSTGQVFDVVPY